MILIGEEQILDEGAWEGSKTSGLARLDAGDHWSDDLSVGQELRAPSAGPADEPALPTADLVALVTSRWVEAEAKAQEQAEEGRRIQERELEVAKTTLADAIETRHATSERELRAALAQIQESVDQVARRENAEADRHAKRLAEDLEERASEIERKLEEASARHFADLLKHYEGLAEEMAEQQSRTSSELESRFNLRASEAEERLETAIEGQSPGEADWDVPKATPDQPATVSNASFRGWAVAGALAVVMVGALLLRGGPSGEHAEPSRVAKGPSVHADKPRQDARSTAKARPRGERNQGLGQHERSSAPDSELVPTAAPEPSPAAAPIAAAPPTPPPSEQSVDAPATDAASESEVQQEFGP